MTKFKSFYTVFLTTIFSFGLPFVALAATPQQLLDEAVRNSPSVPYKMDGEVNASVLEQPLRRKDPKTTVNFVIRFLERIQSKDKSETALTLKSLKTLTDSREDYSLNEPVTLVWRIVSGVTYIKLENLPSLPTNGQADFSQFVGKWIKIDLKNGAAELVPKLPAGKLSDVESAGGFVFGFLEKSKLSPLRVVRLEKRIKTPDGKNVLRLRVRVNPTYVNELERMEKKQVDRKDPERGQKLADITKSYRELRKFFNGTQWVVHLDEAAKSITRVEFGGKNRSVKKECEWNARRQREVCRQTAWTVWTYNGGFNLGSDAALSIETPSESMDLGEVLGKLLSVQTPEETPSEETAP